MHCISEWREHTTVANTHVEDLCVGRVVVLLNDMAKLTLSDADLTVLTAFVTKRLVANVCRIMIYGHMHCIDMCPPLSLPSELLKNKRHHAHLILAHTSHTYYYSRGECSLGIVYCTLTKRTVHARTSSLTPTRGYT